MANGTIKKSTALKSITTGELTIAMPNNSYQKYVGSLSSLTNGLISSSADVKGIIHNIDGVVAVYIDRYTNYVYVCHSNLQSREVTFVGKITFFY